MSVVNLITLNKSFLAGDIHENKVIYCINFGIKYRFL